MTKKTKSPAKKVKNTGSMGRVLFYSVALIVACCAVVVVLYETEAGQELVAKVRGKESSSSRASTSAKAKETESKHSESKPNDAADNSKSTERSESASENAESVSSSDKDTSAKASDNVNDPKHSDSTNDDIRESNDAQQENMASESVPETGSENAGDYANEGDSQMHETASNMDSGEDKEEWENIDEKIDGDEPVEEQEKPVEKMDIPVVEMEKPDVEQEQPVEGETEEHEQPDEPVFVEPEVGQTEEGEGGEMDRNDEQDEKMDETETGPEEVNGGEMGEEETINVGDSLEALERERKEGRKEEKKVEKLKEGERYEPIVEPEGPPIDQSPVNARRGLRGDYGGKGNYDVFHPFIIHVFYTCFTP